MTALITDDIDELFGITGPIDEIGAIARERCHGLADEIALYVDEKHATAAEYRKIGRGFHGG